MAATTMQYTERQLLSGKPKEDDDASEEDFDGDTVDADAVSTTLTIQSGMSRLSYMSRSSVKIKASSSFPNLLKIYDPIREESNVEKLPVKKKKKRWEGSRNGGQTMEEYLDNRARQEHRATRMEAVAREQLEKFDNYMHSMSVKVEKQREDRKRYNELLQERLREQQDIERGKLRLHRRSKHVYIHDRSYLKKLPESRFCKSIRLADEIQRRGLLRTRTDKDKFWAGTGDRNWKGADSLSSDNNANHWKQRRNPHIQVEADPDEHDDESIETTALANVRQLPPIKKLDRTKQHEK